MKRRRRRNWNTRGHLIGWGGPLHDLLTLNFVLFKGHFLSGSSEMFVSHYSCQQYMLLKHLRKVKSIYRLCLLSGNVLGHVLINSQSSQLLSPSVFSGYFVNSPFL